MQVFTILIGCIFVTFNLTGAEQMPEKPPYKHPMTKELSLIIPRAKALSPKKSMHKEYKKKILQNAAHLPEYGSIYC